MANRKYIVELETGVWLAPWDGDPGRTLDVKNAKQFTYKKNAQKAFLQAKKDYPQRKFKHGCVRLVNVKTGENNELLPDVSNSLLSLDDKTIPVTFHVSKFEPKIDIDLGNDC